MEHRWTVYVAGPYSHGETADHVREAVLVGLTLAERGFRPFIPHLYHFAHLICPHDYEWWMALDLSWLEACDCVLRLPGHSPGADREVERAHSLGMPVYHGLPSLYEAVGKAEVLRTED